ncbi:MAG: glutamate ABC transporter substrate-binding protein [Actinoplanes sp.]
MNRLALFLILLPTAFSTACEKVEARRFAAGTTMERLQQAGHIRIGVKSDQPSLGFRNPATNEYEGFDIELAKIVAAELGLKRRQIEFVTATSSVREKFLVEGRVDIVVASYSMSEERQEQVGQAGPYFRTGQHLLVRKADSGRITRPEDVRAERVCSAKGSTSIANWHRKFGGRPLSKDTYTECVQQLLKREVDGVTTDGVVLLGYVAQLPTKLAVVGPVFSEDLYGIGYPKGDRALCEFLSGVLAEIEGDGRWNKAFDHTLGKAGVPAPAKPPIQLCRS